MNLLDRIFNRTESPVPRTPAPLGAPAPEPDATRTHTGALATMRQQVAADERPILGVVANIGGTDTGEEYLPGAGAAWAVRSLAFALGLHRRDISGDLPETVTWTPFDAPADAGDPAAREVLDAMREIARRAMQRNAGITFRNAGADVDALADALAARLYHGDE